MACGRTVLLLVLGLRVLLPAAVSAQPADIRTIVCPGAASTMVGGINSRGDLVGYFYESMYNDDPSLDGGLAGPCRGFFRDRDGAMIELKVLVVR
jgi:hypothetical protein